MKKLLFICFSLLLIGTTMGPVPVSAASVAKNQSISNKEGTIVLTPLSNKVWVHTEYKDLGGGMYPSNGLLIFTSKGIVMVDTSWDESLTAELLDMVKQNFKQNIVKAIITHAHSDRIGGIKVLREHGISAISTPLTANLAVKEGYLPPDPVLDKEVNRLQIGNVKVEAFYPGPAHTEDNIIIWLPQYKIMFGGCMIRSLEVNNLGNLAEANVKEWKQSLQKVMYRYPKSQKVVPGHLSWGDGKLLQHTMDLVNKELEKNS
jgi:metallo-beta-lactamase class B